MKQSDNLSLALLNDHDIMLPELWRDYFEYNDTPHCVSSDDSEVLFFLTIQGEQRAFRARIVSSFMNEIEVTMLDNDNVIPSYWKDTIEDFFTSGINGNKDTDLFVRCVPIKFHCSELYSKFKFKFYHTLPGI